MKITVLGSSHTVAFKQAMEEMQADGSAPAGVDIDFWALGGDQFNKCSLTPDGTFGPDRSLFESDAAYELAISRAERIGGTARIDLTQTDVVMIVGARSSNSLYTRMLSQLDVTGMISIPAALSEVTQATLDGLTRALIDEAGPNGDWSLLSQQTLILVPEPYPSERMLQTDYGGKPGQRLGQMLDEVPAALEAILDYEARVARTIEGRMPFKVLRQPEETIARRVLTAERFAEGARRLNDQAQPGKDILHANADYGRCYWDHILTYVNAA